VIEGITMSMDEVNFIMTVASLIASVASLVASFVALWMAKHFDTASTDQHRATRRDQHALGESIAKIENSQAHLQGIFSESLRTGHELSKDLGEQRTSLGHLNEILNRLSGEVGGLRIDYQVAINNLSDRYFALLPHQMESGQAEQREKITQVLAPVIAGEALERAATQVQQALNKLPSDATEEILALFERSGKGSVTATQWAAALGPKYQASVFQLLQQARDDGLLEYDDPIGRTTRIELRKTTARSDHHG
jgi:hypothetical protein